jgi:hypothetical protein
VLVAATLALCTTLALLVSTALEPTASPPTIVVAVATNTLLDDPLVTLPAPTGLGTVDFAGSALAKKVSPCVRVASQ